MWFATSKAGLISLLIAHLFSSPHHARYSPSFLYGFILSKIASLWAIEEGVLPIALARFIISGPPLFSLPKGSFKYRFNASINPSRV